jgi:hypothetical protein
MEINTLEGLLEWLVIGGGGVALFVLVAEKWEWFQRLDSENKKLYSNVVASLIALGSALLLQAVPPEVLGDIDLAMKVIVGVIVSIYGKEVFHKIVNK